jgi:hypothetical protein
MLCHSFWLVNLIGRNMTHENRKSTWNRPVLIAPDDVIAQAQEGFSDVLDLTRYFDLASFRQNLERPRETVYKVHRQKSAFEARRSFASNEPMSLQSSRLLAAPPSTKGGPPRSAFPAPPVTERRSSSAALLRHEIGREAGFKGSHPTPCSLPRGHPCATREYRESKQKTLVDYISGP